MTKTCHVTHATTTPTIVDHDSIFFEKIINVGFKLALSALTEHDEDAAARLQVRLQCYKLPTEEIKTI